MLGTRGPSYPCQHIGNISRIVYPNCYEVSKLPSYHEMTSDFQSPSDMFLVADSIVHSNRKSKNASDVVLSRSIYSSYYHPSMMNPLVVNIIQAID